MIGIYKITNPKGKIYIGSSTNIENRFKYYQKLKAKTQTKLFNSLKKFSPENHKFEVIEICDGKILFERERYWQEKFDVLGLNGLNCTLVNTEYKNGLISEETKQKMSDARLGKEPWNKGVKNPYSDEFINFLREKNLGKKQTDETIQKRREKMVGKPSGMKGKTHNEVTKKLMSESAKKIIKTDEWLEKIIKNKQKKIKQIDLNNNIVKEWDSLKDAANTLNINKSGICLALKGKIKTYKNYKWTYND